MSQIDDLRASLARTRLRMKELEAPFSFPADCCPSCACGPEWNYLSGKQDRRAAWLRVLLLRRGTYEDLYEVQILEFDYDAVILELLHPAQHLRRYGCDRPRK